jgi:hypothetical protein
MANELEICESSQRFVEQNRQWFIALFGRFEGLVSAKAFAEYRKTFIV